MDAIRQFKEVKNHSFQVTLPDDFNAKRVEIIIFPLNEEVTISVTIQPTKLQKKLSC